MTTATRLHQQGFSKGTLEERKKNHYLVIKKGSQAGLTTQLLANLTDLTIEEVKEILKEMDLKQKQSKKK